MFLLASILGVPGAASASTTPADDPDEGYYPRTCTNYDYGGIALIPGAKITDPGDVDNDCYTYDPCMNTPINRFLQIYDGCTDLRVRDYADDYDRDVVAARDDFCVFHYGTPEDHGCPRSYYKDSDGDGLSDFEETESRGSNPYLKNTDGDGSDDYQEYIKRTDPADPASRPVQVTPVTVDFTLTVNKLTYKKRKPIVKLAGLSQVASVLVKSPATGNRWRTVKRNVQPGTTVQITRLNTVPRGRTLTAYVQAVAMDDAVLPKTVKVVLTAPRKR